MASALFIHTAAPGTGAGDLANLGALACTARDAGLAPRLLIVELDGGTAPDSVPDVFAAVRRIALPGAGDGAATLDAVVTDSPALIVTPAGLSARNWAARLAARLDAGFVPACDGLSLKDGGLVATEPVMGGMMRRHLALRGAMVLLYAGDSLAFTGDLVPLSAPAEVVAVAGPRLVRRAPLPDTGGIPLKGASRIVSGGLGVGSAENWPRIEAFAARVGAAVGASRAAVDMGWVPSTRQIGFSGQKVAPDVYVAVGISGAVHHLAGIAGARRIVAINKDPEAPILQVADVAIVGDCLAVLDAALKRLGQ
ncbi:MAG: electron transfer flavoprotein subunit alpha/FixB family protein [Rubellimicrobium sp.]|nr:electron transfer flavoprotein subunit alpha/FixB family protein [Rubellimicrobium sp.]